MLCICFVRESFVFRKTYVRNTSICFGSTMSCRRNLHTGTEKYQYVLLSSSLQSPEIKYINMTQVVGKYTQIMTNTCFSRSIVFLPTYVRILLVFVHFINDYLLFLLLLSSLLLSYLFICYLLCIYFVNLAIYIYIYIYIYFIFFPALFDFLIIRRNKIFRISILSTNSWRDCLLFKTCTTLNVLSLQFLT